MSSGISNGVLPPSFLFRNISKKSAESLKKKLKSKKLKKNAVVFQQDDIADAMFFILQGAVEISLDAEDGHKISLITLRAGEAFGEIALLDGGVRTASATVMEDAHLQFISRNDFLEISNSFSANDWRTMVICVCDILRRSNKNLETSYFQDSAQKVASGIIRARADYSSAEKKLELLISQDYLAKIVGLSRETVNRTLKSFEKDHLLQLQYRKIILIDLETLKLIAAQGLS